MIAVALLPAPLDDDDPVEPEPLLAVEPVPLELEPVVEAPLKLVPDELERPAPAVDVAAPVEEPAPVFDDDDPDLACALSNAINACSVSCSTDRAELEPDPLPPSPVLPAPVPVVLVVIV